MIKIILAILILLPFVSAARPMDDRAVLSERDIFETTLYPFMKKNCIECHGEQAVYPAGPAHTHSNVNTAFKTFSKFVNKNDFAKSAFIKYASNKHFCKEFGVNCPQQNQIVDELNSLFASYSTQAKVLQGSSTTSGMMVTREDQVLTQDVIVGSTKLQLKLTLKKFSDEYKKITSISLTSESENSLSFDGIDIRINGQPPQKATGLEGLRRNLLFVDMQMTTQLMPAREVILAVKNNDRISIQLKNLKPARFESSPLCADPAKRELIVFSLRSDPTIKENFLMNLIGDLKTVQTMTEELYCDQIMLQVHLERPSQSILVLQAPKSAKTEMVKQVTAIKALLNPAKEIVEKRLNITELVSSNTNTCFKLENGEITCFGQDLGSNSYQFSTGNKNVLVSVGTYGFAYNTSPTSFTVPSGSSQILPFVLQETSGYDAKEDLAGLGVGYRMMCYLTKSGDVYCGGPDLQILGFDDFGSKFYKINTTPISKISVRSNRLLMISTKNDLYFFGLERSGTYKFDGLKTLDADSASADGSDSSEIHRMAQAIQLNFKVMAVVQTPKSVCLTDIEGRPHCYSPNPRLEFGIERSGDIPAPERNFKQMLMFSTGNGSCGVTSDQSLYCYGEYPLGLRNADQGISSREYKKIVSVPKNFKLVSSGANQICVVSRDNIVSCASGGERSSGQIGNGGPSRDQFGREIFEGPNPRIRESGTVSPYVGKRIQ